MSYSLNPNSYMKEYQRKKNEERRKLLDEVRIVNDIGRHYDFFVYTNINLDDVIYKASQSVKIVVIEDRLTNLYKLREKILFIKNKGFENEIVSLCYKYILGDVLTDSINDLYKKIKNQ